MKHHIGLAALYVVLGLLLASLVGCGAEDPTGPELPLPGGDSTSYDGSWTADFGPADYPVRGLRFEIRGGAFMGASMDSFWDLLQCSPPSFTDTPFDAAPGPVLIVNDAFTTPAPMVSPPLTIEVLSVTFTSASTAVGNMRISMDAGGACVGTNLAVRPFTATRS